MTPEETVVAVGITLIYALCSAMTSCFPIKHGGLQAVAMALWPVTLVVVLFYLPFLIWVASEEDRKRRDRITK